MLLLSNRDAMAVLDMAAALEALRVGYDDLERGDAAYIPRIDMYSPTGRDADYYQWGSMAGTCRSYGVTAVRIKSDVASWPDGRTQEKYCVRPGLYSGIILLYSTDDGAPLALLQDGYIQHLRVGAAAGIGAELLARPDSSRLALLGSGGMAWTYLEALALVLPVREVRVYSPTAANREALANRACRELGLDVVAVPTPRDAVEGADVVATATDSMGPTFDPAWLSPGAHVTCVTRRELGAALLDRADVVVQLGVNTVPRGTPVPGMQWAAGGIAAYLSGSPEERARIPAASTRETGVYPSLLDVRRGQAPGRSDREQVSLFITTGTQGLQFAAVAGRTLQLAQSQGAGTTIPTEWFLQDIRD